MQITKSKWFLPAVRGRARPRPLLRAVDRRRRAERARFARHHGRLRRARAARRAQRNDPGLRGDGRDERFRQIDIHATAVAGLAVISAIIIAFVVELARGHSGNPYGWLGAIAGLAYLAAIVVFRLRG